MTPWLVLLPVLVAAAAYARVLDGEMQLDDFVAVAGNPAVRDVGAALRRVLDPSAWAGRPVTELTFALNYAAAGLRPRPYHLANLGIHLANVVLAFLFTRRVLRLAGAARAAGTSLAVASLFALHPLQSQAVSYVAQRSEALASGLYLAALLLLLEAERRGRGWRGAAAYAGGVAAFTLALGTKVIAVTLPAAYLLLPWVVPGAEGRKALASWPRRLLLALPLAALDAYVGLAAVRGLGGQVSAGFDVPGLSPGTYFVSQWRVVATYLRLLAWPAGQSLEWDLRAARSPLEPAVLGSGLLLAGLAAGAALLSWRSRARQDAAGAAGRVASFGVAWFFLLLVPTSSFVPLADLLMEHRVYLAAWGIFAAAAVGGERLASRLHLRPAVVAALAAATCAALALALHQRNAVWETRLALAADSAAKSPRKARAHANLGHALGERGDHEGAVRAYRLALAHAGGVAPFEAILLRNLASALSRQGRLDEAVEVLRRAAARDPANADVLANLAVALVKKRDLGGAEEHARRALALQPGHGQAWSALGSVRLERGDAEGAVEAYERAVRAEPDDAVRHYNLAVAYGRTGRAAAACDAWRQVLRLEGGGAVREQAARHAAAGGCAGN